MLAVSTYTLGQTRKAAQPTQVQSSSKSTPDRQPPADEGREEGTHEDARAERGDEQAHPAARQPLLLADDDDREQDAWPDEVREPEEQRDRPQEGVVPQEAEPSTSRERTEERPASRSSWNGVRIARSAPAENT